jgi:hypothetical protein
MKISSATIWAMLGGIVIYIFLQLVFFNAFAMLPTFGKSTDDLNIASILISIFMAYIIYDKFK